MLSWLHVVRMGRLSKNDRLHLDFFEKLFDDRWKKQSVLVLTYYDGDMGQQKEALLKWCGEEEYIKKFLTSFAEVIITDNAMGRNKESTRKECLVRLQSSILCPGIIHLVLNHTCGQNWWRTYWIAIFGCLFVLGPLWII